MTTSALIQNIRHKISKKNISVNDINDCLNQIKCYIESVVENPFYNGLLLNIPEFDELCLLLGKRLVPKSGLSEAKFFNKSKTILYMVSQLYLSGGHTAVLEDFIKAQKEYKHIIIYTGLFDKVEKELIQKRFSSYQVEFIFPLKSKKLTDKILWLQQQWIKIIPEKCFLFIHHQDVIAIAAAQPDMPGDLYYYHHADYILGLGKNLPHAKHIDINPLTYSYCRHEMKLDNIYCPLTCEDNYSEQTADRIFAQNNILHTASSGAAAKFLQLYAYSYIDLLPILLKISKGSHTHIGYLPEYALKRIKKILKLHNVSPEKFMYIPWVKNVGQELINRNIDIYIASFPVGGGRTAIEVMASGTPIICHQNYRSVFLSEQHLLYPESFVWQNPEELFAILSAQCSSDNLKQHGKWARSYYLQHYTHNKLEELIENNFEHESSENIELIDTNIPNKTQLFLDLTQEWKFKTNLFKKILRFLFRYLTAKK
jgi:hypothetical protein